MLFLIDIIKHAPSTKTVWINFSPIDLLLSTFA